MCPTEYYESQRNKKESLMAQYEEYLDSLEEGDEEDLDFYSWASARS